MFIAMKRMGIDTTLSRLVKLLYQNTTCKVEVEGTSSNLQEQHTGIRQGCPLSPYLFLIVMTVMFEDVHSKLDQQVSSNRTPGADFDEVAYADDTICFSTDSRTTNQFIQAF